MCYFKAFFTLLLILGSFFLLPMNTIGQDMVCVKELVDSYERWANSFGAFSFHYRNSFGESGDVNYDGRNIRVIQNLFRDNQLSSASYCEDICYNGTYLLFEHDPNAEEPGIISSLEPTRENLDIIQCFRYGFIFGIVPFDNYRQTITIANLLERISEPTVSAHNDELTIQGKVGRYSVKATFLAEYSYALKHFSTHCVPESIKLSLDNVLDIVDFSITAEKFEGVNGIYVPTVILHSIRHVTATWKQEGDNYVQVPVVMESAFEVGLELSDYKLNRKFNDGDFSLTKKVPNGTPVYMQDAAHIEYIWLDGKIVPKTNKAMLALLRGHKFMPGPGEPRFWLMLIGIILILVSGGRLAYKHFTSKD